MKIAIIGARGIPNNYGGFEQFAERLSLGLIGKGHEVLVYNSHIHPYKQNTWKGVKIVHKYDPENIIGTFGQFVYDLNCILNTRKQKPDVIIQLGYTSSSIWHWLLPSTSKVLTNMDGLEWKRDKYNSHVKTFLKYAEKLAAINSTVLIADSRAIGRYLKEKYSLESEYIPYGATQFLNPDATVLDKIGVKEYNYDLLIARMEPENNIEIILSGLKKSKSSRKFLLVGNNNTTYGNHLEKKFDDPRIIFAGPIYDQILLNNLRYYSNIYFHGHSVGGTNPSLLEAMASNALICAHENEFNKEVLEGNALYFSDPAAVSNILNTTSKGAIHTEMIRNNILKINDCFSWEKIIDRYNDLIVNKKN